MTEFNNICNDTEMVLEDEFINLVTEFKFSDEIDLKCLDDDYIKASWCGDIDAANRIKNIAFEHNPYGEAYFALLLYNGYYEFQSDLINASKYALSSLSFLQSIENNNNRVCNYLLGMFFYNGIGIRENINIAFNFFNNAAINGHLNAEYQLGLYYEQDIDSEENHRLALYHFEKAANMNHPQALFSVGYFYMKGIGITIDTVKGFNYFNKAGELGHAAALTNIGTCYQFGNGVEINESKAVKYFELSELKCDPYGTYNLAVCYEEGISGIDINMNKAINLYIKAAKLGHINANLEIGMHYFNGTCGFLPSDVIAFKHFKFAADNDNENGLYRVGFCYMIGRGINKNINLAIEYFEKAILKDHKVALIDLAFCFVCCVGDKNSICRAKILLNMFLTTSNYFNNYSFLTVIEPVWEMINVSGYMMYEESSKFNLHFLDNVTKTIIPEKSFEINVSRQWLLDAAPLLKVGLLFTYLTDNTNSINHLDLVMSVIQNQNLDYSKRYIDVYCAGSSNDILKHACNVISKKINQR